MTNKLISNDLGFAPKSSFFDSNKLFVWICCHVNTKEEENRKGSFTSELIKIQFPLFPRVPGYEKQGGGVHIEMHTMKQNLFNWLSCQIQKR